MKKTLLAFCMVGLSVYALGQAQDGTVNYQKNFGQSPAAMIYLPYSPNIVKAAMQHYKAQSLNLIKGRHTGYQSFQNTLLVQNDRNYADLIFEIGLKDMDDKNISVVYLMLDSPIENIDHSGTVNHFSMEQAIAYLNNMALAIRPYALNKQIELQTSLLRKAEANQAKLVKKYDKMHNRNEHMSNTVVNPDKGSRYQSEKLNRDIAANELSQATQKLEIEKQKQNLTQLASLKNVRQ